MLQKINRKDLFNLYEAVKNCSTWKGKIEKALIDQQLNDDIEVEDSVLVQAYNEANATQKALLNKYFDIKSSKKIIDKISTVDDLFVLTGKTKEDTLPYKNPINKAQLSQNGLATLQVMTEAYNQGGVVDFKNRSQKKFYLWWQKNASGSWVLVVVYDSYYYAGSGFGCYFLDADAARDAAVKFKNVFLDFLPE